MLLEYFFGFLTVNLEHNDIMPTNMQKIHNTFTFHLDIIIISNHFKYGSTHGTLNIYILVSDNNLIIELYDI